MLEIQLEQKQVAEAKSLPQTDYITLPYPRQYYSKFIEERLGENFVYTPEMTYSIEAINTLFKNNSKEFLNDAPRTAWKMGRNTEEKASHYGGDSIDVIIAKQKSDSEKSGINLTENETRALIAFAIFYNNEFAQGGALSSQKWTMGDFFASYAIVNGNYGLNPHIIDREEKQLIILHKSPLKNKDGKSEPVIIENEFNIRQVEHNFTLTIKKNDIKIHKEFWQNTIIPAALEKLSTITKFENRDLFHFIPLLCEEYFAFEFFVKLLQQPPENLKKTQEYIDLCFFDRPDDKAKIEIALQCARAMPQPDITFAFFEKLLQQSPEIIQKVLEYINASLFRQPAQKLEVATKLQCVYAKRELESLLYKKNKTIGPRRDAAIMLENLNAASKNIASENLVPLTLFLRRVATSIRSPKLDNNLQELINMGLNDASWNTLVGGSGIILAFAGSVIIAASIALAIASFGGSSVFSAWGIAVGTTLLTKLAATIAATVGLGMIAGGIKYIDNKPSYFANQNSLFWRRLRNQASVELPQASENLNQQSETERSGLLSARS